MNGFPILITALAYLSSCTTREPPTVEVAPEDRCETVRASVVDAGFADRVTVTCTDEHVTLSSDTYPDHTLMTGITATNEQIPVPGTWAPSIPLLPRGTQGRTSNDAAVGIAVNGVPIYDYTKQGDLQVDAYNPADDTVVQGELDVCNGHAGRGDDYHYHASPDCMIAVMKNAGDNAIIGWGLDGYPLYGHNNPDGSAIQDGRLDVCNGQPDDTFGYRYHTSAGPPYILQCLVGEVDVRAIPKVSPLSAASGWGSKPSGTPPAGGVQGLVHTQGADGRRTMTYQYQGKDYQMSYIPTATAGCYNFDMDTVSMGVVTGEYCR